MVGILMVKSIMKYITRMGKKRDLKLFGIEMVIRPISNTSRTE